MTTKAIRIFGRTAPGLLGAVLLIFLLTAGARAETVSQKQAAQIARTFFNAANKRVQAPPKMAWNGRRLTTDRLFSPFYVYNNPAGGFVIISAENKAFPILGYSLTDRFDPNDIGMRLKTLLSLYAGHIERVRYDSRVPEKAIAAWGDINGYIAGMLATPYEATDVLIDPAEAEKEIDSAIDSERIDSLVSNFYTPRIWEEMVADQLARRQNVVMGLISPEEVVPVILHGRKGDYYRINLDKQNRALFRLFPTEILSQGEMAVLDSPAGFPTGSKEEKPFTFYNDFIASAAAEREAQRSRIEQTLLPSEPVVNTIGAGHYMIRLPENVRSASVYNIAGAEVLRLKYRDTTDASIDISTEPYGFYICLLEGESGKPYTVKIFR